MRDYLVVGVALMVTLLGAYYTARALEQEPPAIARHSRAASVAATPQHRHHAEDVERAFLHKNAGAVR